MALLLRATEPERGDSLWDTLNYRLIVLSAGLLEVWLPGPLIVLSFYRLASRRSGPLALLSSHRLIVLSSGAPVLAVFLLSYYRLFVRDSRPFPKVLYVYHFVFP